MDLGERIARARKQENLTQAALAEMVGVSTEAVSKWESGAGLPDVTQIVPLAQALNVSTDALFP